MTQHCPNAREGVNQDLMGAFQYCREALNHTVEALSGSIVNATKH